MPAVANNVDNGLAVHRQVKGSPHPYVIKRRLLGVDLKASHTTGASPAHGEFIPHVFVQFLGLDRIQGGRRLILHQDLS